MSTNVLGYVIINEIEGKSPEFLALDEDYYWSPFINSARVFKTFDDAEDLILTSSDFNKIGKTTDGTIYPPSLLHRASKVNSDKLTGSCTISVSLLKLDSYSTREFECEIKKPTGFTYN